MGNRMTNGDTGPDSPINVIYITRHDTVIVENVKTVDLDPYRLFSLGYYMNGHSPEEVIKHQLTAEYFTAVYTECTASTDRHPNTVIER